MAGCELIEIRIKLHRMLTIQKLKYLLSIFNFPEKLIHAVFNFNRLVAATLTQKSFSSREFKLPFLFNFQINHVIVNLYFLKYMKTSIM